jgi:orotidine-5'-phosphate decarboxylase
MSGKLIDMNVSPGDAEHFSDRLATAIRRLASPVLVGLDPRAENLPPGVASHDLVTRADWAAAYTRFCTGVIDVVAPLVPAVKPQAACFEQLGHEGMKSLADVVAHARRRGLLVVLDGKRNDIGSTAAAYAKGFLGRYSAWGADALTVSPYLGDDSLRPFVDVARASGCGVFILVKTSNPGGAQFQDLVADGRPLYRHVGQYVERLATESLGRCGYGAVGAVVGATYPEQLAELRGEMPHAWFLVPGYGSQGGTARGVAGAFDSGGLGAVVNNSRGIIYAYARPEFVGRFGVARWQEAVEAATREMIEELRAETNAGKLMSRT